MGPYKKTMTKACDVCGKPIKIDQFGNGKCKSCGWVNDRPEFTKKTNYPNFLSLDDARKAYHEGRKLLPTFEIFLDILSRGFEMALWYNGNKYGAMKDCNVSIFICGTTKKIFRNTTASRNSPKKQTSAAYFSRTFGEKSKKSNTIVKL